MTMRRFLIVMTAVFLVGAVLMINFLSSAPVTSGVIIQDTPVSTPVTSNCRPSTQDDQACLVFPGVSGDNLDGEKLAFPDDFEAPLNFVVMPFDREQQVRAIAWLPTVQELAEDLPDLNFYSIAALPDLTPAVRLMVTGGMSGIVQEGDVRAATVILYLEEQAIFAEALEIDDLATIQVFLLNDKGEILWRDSGDYDESKGEILRKAVQEYAARG